jgi:hypothetical protein
MTILETLFLLVKREFHEGTVRAGLEPAPTAENPACRG